MLAVAGTTTQAFGSIYQGAAAHGEGQYKAAVAFQNAALSVDQARDARSRGEKEADLRWRDIAATKSAQIALAAANGLDTSFGSAADLVGDTAQLGMEDIAQIGQNQEHEVRGYLIQAQNYRNEARAAKRGGRQAMIAGGLNAASTILGSAQTMKAINLPGMK